ncbi:hypothetical protein ACFL4N_01765 [Thermodesulfobacteriota bacterium]
MNEENEKSVVSIEEGSWYYFTVDLDFDGFASLNFIRYLNVNNDRKAALVKILDKDYFNTKTLILLPYTKDEDYFKASPSDFLSVWAFDGSEIDDEDSIDLKTDWPKNILDKAAITPSIETAKEWTENK